MQLTRQGDISDKASLPAQEFLIFEAANRRADTFVRQC